MGNVVKTGRIILKKEEIYRGNLLLVNREHPLRCGDAGELVPADCRYEGILLRRIAAQALQAAIREIGAEEDVVPVSGWRSMEEQTAIYQSCLEEEGEEYTRKYVALPGCSEHQSGLAIDLGLKKEHIDFICPDFPYEGICQKFREIAPEFGFIERYPAGKEDITGIGHEPWHFRYVGRPHSAVMADRELTLEEYVDFLKQYGEDGPFYYRETDNALTRIYYIPGDGERTLLTLPGNADWEISGNNGDGFIVTFHVPDC